jgi:hypothetical protein
MSQAVTQVGDIKVPVPPKELERIPLVRNNRSFGWISDRVSAITEGKTPLWWWAAFIPSFCFLGLLGVMLTYQVSTGVGVWGNHHPTDVGLGHYQFRVVDRYWPRRDADFSDSLPASPEVADGRQPRF